MISSGKARPEGIRGDSGQVTDRMALAAPEPVSLSPVRAGPQSGATGTQRRRGRSRTTLRRAALPLLGAAILLVVSLAAIVGPMLSPFDGYKQDLRGRLQPPGWADKTGATHPFGTDQLGRDVLTRSLLGARLSLLIGFVAVLGAGMLGTFLGLFAAYRGGLLDDLVMRLVDLQLALPMILLALVIVALLGPSLRNVILVFVITGWPIFAPERTFLSCWGTRST